MTARRTSVVVGLALAQVLAGCGRRHPLQPDAGSGDGAAAETNAPKDATDTALDDAPVVEADADAAADATSGRADAPATFTAALVSFCHDVAPHWCAARKRCGELSVLDSECEAVEEARCTSQLDVWQALAASKGRLAFDASRAAGYFAFLDDTRCNALDFSGAPACGAVLVGKVAEGAPCVYGAECAEGSCGTASDVPECVATCVSPGKPGALCAELGQPDCDLRVAWCNYAMKTCVAKKARGDACTDLEGLQETQCANTDFCRAPRGVPCNHTAGDATGCQCAARGAPGAACQLPDQCQRGLFCTRGACAAEILEGEPCSGRGCADGLVCDPTAGGELNDPGTCVRPPAAGQPCGASFLHPCAPGLTCDQFKRCHRLPLEGEPCGDSGLCLGANVTCSGETNRCARIPTAGQRCFDRCDAASYCDGAATKTCLPKKAGGEACAASVECRAGLCERTRGCGMAICPSRCAEVCSYASADGGI